MTTEGSGASRGAGDALHNEDAFLAEDGLGLYVVCDGASGTPAGEVASELAVAALEDFIQRSEKSFGHALRLGRASPKVVERALRFALGTVVEASHERAELRDMMTTVTMLLTHGNHGVIGHAGDSRAYLIRGSRSFQLTIDHELTAPAANGGDESTEIDAFGLELSPRDTLVLCTDGAEDVVQEPGLVRGAANLSPQLLASRIVSAAHRLNPERDATAVVVRVRGEREPGWLALSNEPREASFGHVLIPA